MSKSILEKEKKKENLKKFLILAKYCTQSTGKFSFCSFFVIFS